MLVFKGKKTYEDYIKTIANNMTSDTFEFLSGFENERGLKYLFQTYDIKKQQKIMKTLSCIDKDMTEEPRKDEMYKKLSYFLKAGILFEEYAEYLINLTPEAISTLLTENTFSMNDEMTRKYIAILSDNDFLMYLRNNYKIGELDDIMLAITNHYDKDPFDIYDSKLVKNFQRTTRVRLVYEKDKYINEVPTYSDLAYALWHSEQETGGKKK